MRLDLHSLTDSALQTKAKCSFIMLKDVTDYAVFAFAAVLTGSINSLAELQMN
jgi:hypothetical protein